MSLAILLEAVQIQTGHINLDSPTLIKQRSLTNLTQIRQRSPRLSLQTKQALPKLRLLIQAVQLSGRITRIDQATIKEGQIIDDITAQERQDHKDKVAIIKDKEAIISIDGHIDRHTRGKGIIGRVQSIGTGMASVGIATNQSETGLPQI